MRRHVANLATVVGIVLGIISLLTIFSPRLIKAFEPPPSSQISITHAEFDLATKSILVPILNTGELPSYFLGAALINEQEKFGLFLNLYQDEIAPFKSGLYELRLQESVFLKDSESFTILNENLSSQGLNESKNNNITIFFRDSDGTVRELQTSISNGSILSFVNANGVDCSVEGAEWQKMFNLGPPPCSDLNKVHFEGGLGSVQAFRQYVRDSFLEGK
jgi:hypothetical protein